MHNRGAPAISRRLLLASAGTLILSSFAATQPAKVWRIGYLAAGLEIDPLFLQAFLDGLRALGYVQGQNVVIDYRSAEGRFESLAVLAQELVSRKVDVIVAPTTPVARAAKGASNSIPIVFTAVGDPLGAGLVSSLSRPGGNITGITDMGIELAGKQLDLLKQMIPGLKRVGALGDPADKVWGLYWKEAQVAAQQLKIDIVPVLVTTPTDLERAFAELKRRVEAILCGPQAIFSVHLRRVIELTSLSRLPAIHEAKGYPAAGALMSYGPDYVALLRQAARPVAKILEGSRPADIPVEQPTEYEFVINLKTAKAIGLRVPQSLLARANEVIR
jgi:putative tryptophan/tyrosine transport system substrate-binding protein